MAKMYGGLVFLGRHTHTQTDCDQALAGIASEGPITIPAHAGPPGEIVPLAVLYISHTPWEADVRVVS